MPDEGPRPSDIQPVSNETRDRIITGLVTLVPFIAIGLAGWQVWGEALHWSDVFLFIGMYLLTGLGVTVGFHRHLTHRSFKAKTWLHGLLAILGSAAIEASVVLRSRCRVMNFTGHLRQGRRQLRVGAELGPAQHEDVERKLRHGSFCIFDQDARPCDRPQDRRPGRIHSD